MGLQIGTWGDYFDIFSGDYQYLSISNFIREFVRSFIWPFNLISNILKKLHKIHEVVTSIPNLSAQASPTIETIQLDGQKVADAHLR